MAVDMFLDIEGVKGESKDETHKDKIDVYSWSLGITNSGNTLGGGLGAGKAQPSDFNFTMMTSKASPELFIKCCKGTHIPTATFISRKAGDKQQEYLQVKFYDLLVSSFHAGGSQGSAEAVDQISLNFSKMEYTYREQKPDGTLSGDMTQKYDFKAQKG